MPIPQATIVKFEGLEFASVHITEVVEALQAATAAIALTKPAIISSDCDPDNVTTQVFRDQLLAVVQLEDIRAPLVAALEELKGAVGVVLEAYGCQPL